MNQQLPLPEIPDAFEDVAGGAQRWGAFTSNMKLPVHRWFRYSAGFSAEWCAAVIAGEPSARSVLDPFAGSGTTLLAAQSLGVRSYGFEAHDFVARVAQAKLQWAADPPAFQDAAMRVLAAARAAGASAATPTTPLLAKCFVPASLQRLCALRSAYEAFDYPSEGIRQLVWLTLTSVLRETSHVGTAQWQYVLPKKSKARTADPFVAFEAKVHEISSDMNRFAVRPPSEAVICRHDARQTCGAIGASSIDLVVTSPPYPNNYDYADATRLEMSFWGEVERWGDLHAKVRRHLITSCSQHSAAERADLEDILADPVLLPILPELSAACRELDALRTTRSGKKTYHTMAASYFRDLANVWIALRHHVKAGGSCHFVIGDSAPYGVHLPVERWLGELALAAGFDCWSFDRFRDRNIKWRNRKHRVPLKEGVLVVT